MLVEHFFSTTFRWLFIFSLYPSPKEISKCAVKKQSNLLRASHLIHFNSVVNSSVLSVLLWYYNITMLTNSSRQGYSTREKY